MRWMMIALLVSVVALLLAAAGVARHIWLHRSQIRGSPGSRPASDAAGGAVFDPVEEADFEAHRESDQEVKR
jgi:hypothetical protein